MVYKLRSVIDFAPLFMVNAWQTMLPSGELNVVSASLLVVAVALLVRTMASEIRPRGERLLILGAGPLSAKLIDEIEAPAIRRYTVVGIVDDAKPEEGTPAARRWLGTCDQFTEIVDRVRPARIVVAIADRRDRLPLQALLESRVRGIEVEDALEFSERLTGKIAIEALRPSTLILSKGFKNHGAAEVTGRFMSVIAAIAGLALALPLLALIAALVKLDSRGPVFFIQQRSGRNGRPFGLIKFRTMHPCSEHTSEWVFDNLHRITRVGQYLRRFRLDELPQLVNVLRGDMNVIGPRPHPTSNQSIFMQKIAYYGLRSTVRPGVTGWAQVRYGYANNLDEETEKMRYDLYYIKNRSLWLDLRILLETVAIVLVGQGATEIKRRTPPHREKGRLPSRPRTDATYLPWLPGSTPAQPRVTRQ